MTKGCFLQFYADIKFILLVSDLQYKICWLPGIEYLELLYNIKQYHIQIESRPIISFPQYFFPLKTSGQNLTQFVPEYIPNTLIMLTLKETETCRGHVILVSLVKVKGIECPLLQRASVTKVRYFQKIENNLFSFVLSKSFILKQ